MSEKHFEDRGRNDHAFVKAVRAIGRIEHRNAELAQTAGAKLQKSHPALLAKLLGKFGFEHASKWVRHAMMAGLAASALHAHEAEAHQPMAQSGVMVEAGIQGGVIHYDTRAAMPGQAVDSHGRPIGGMYVNGGYGPSYGPRSVGTAGYMPNPGMVMPQQVMPLRPPAPPAVAPLDLRAPTPQYAVAGSRPDAARAQVQVSERNYGMFIEITNRLLAGTQPSRPEAEFVDKVFRDQAMMGFIDQKLQGMDPAQAQIVSTRIKQAYSLLYPAAPSSEDPATAAARSAAQNQMRLAGVPEQAPYRAKLEQALAAPDPAPGSQNLSPAAKKLLDERL